MGSEQRNIVKVMILSALILFGWNYFFPPAKNNAPVGPGEAPKSDQITKEKALDPSKADLSQSGPIEPAIDENFTIAGGEAELTFNNSLSVVDFTNKQAAFDFDNTVGVKTPMRIEFDFGNGFQTLKFSKVDNKFYNSSYDTTVTTIINGQGVVIFDISSTKQFKYRFIYKSSAKKLENSQVRAFAFYTDELNKVIVGDEETGDRSIKWAGIDFNYHLFASYFDKPQNLIFQVTQDNSFSLHSNVASTNLKYNLVFVKKEYNYLTKLGNNLNNSVDFGIWGFFAVWILKGLQFFHTFIPNYGISIILLTLLIRLITFPLQYKSFVSMKKLQLIQPELSKIREKFKDDPQRLQKESMELFRKHGANPLGGCLPLILQMPVFFAFYKVLYSAVELVDAPFFLWIHDLSNKDPFYVLPVLMTGAMFLQQKLTPNTISDPVQKRMMMFMPLVFGFIMKDLPSGLSLYIFVSTIFGILQQLFVFKRKT